MVYSIQYILYTIVSLEPDVILLFGSETGAQGRIHRWAPILPWAPVLFPILGLGAGARGIFQKRA